jgi:hypothetical protein
MRNRFGLSLLFFLLIFNGCWLIPTVAQESQDALSVDRVEKYLGYIPGTSGMQCAIQDFLDIVEPGAYTGVD